MSIQNGSLSGLVTRDKYRESRQHLFQSETSLDWFVRQNRDRLIKAGALSVIANRTLVDEERCDRVVMELGAEQAAARFKVVE